MRQKLPIYVTVLVPYLIVRMIATYCAQRLIRPSQTANKINEFADLLNQMRNDTQADIKASVDRVNDYLEQIAELNQQIKFQLNSGSTAAQLQDYRDNAIKNLTKEMDISFFVRGDGVMVVQTREGQELASEFANELVFSPTPSLNKLLSEFWCQRIIY